MSLINIIGWEYSVDQSIGNYVAVEKVYHMSRRRRLIRRRKLQDVTKNVKEDVSLVIGNSGHNLLNCFAGIPLLRGCFTFMNAFCRL